MSHKANTRRIHDCCNDYGEGGKDKTAVAMSMGEGLRSKAVGRTKVSYNDYGSKEAGGQVGTIII